MTRMDFWDRANAVYPSTENTSGYLKPLARLFSPGRRVADLGCGRGEMLALLRDAGHTAIGVDLSRRSQDWAAESGFDFHRVDVLDFLAKPPVAFNALFSYGLLEHLDVEDFRRLFRLAGENSPSGTEVVFATHDPSSLQSHLSPLYQDVTHSRLYALESVASELEANGFHVKKSGSIEQTESLVPASALSAEENRKAVDVLSQALGSVDPNSPLKESLTWARYACGRLEVVESILSDIASLLIRPMDYYVLAVKDGEKTA